ncbi:MAG: hypothetical protein U0703_09460 [Anaerolineae bacterium]
MTTQVLIVHGQLPFAIKLKQTLERSAPFEAHPFTSVEAAVEYLTDHVQDVAVVDFAMTEYTGEQIIQQLRGVQPNIAVIAAPKQDAAKTSALGIAASLNAGFSAQDLVRTINDYFARNERPSLESPGTTALLSRLGRGQRPMPSQSDLLPEYSSLDDVLSQAGTNIFEQPAAEGDTPANFPEELDWMEESSSKRESSFDDVLNSLPPDAPNPSAPSSPFNDLVNSMRTEEAHRPLPSRQQQLVEFILSGGTDSLDNEPPPAQPQTAPLSQEEIEAAMRASEPVREVEPEPEPEPPSDDWFLPSEPPPEPPKAPEPPRSPLLSAFDRLSKEEPAPPEFEESGTVSDLVGGVQDRSFRNVLSILGGSEGAKPRAGRHCCALPGDFDVGPRRAPDRAALNRRYFQV